MLRQLVGDDVFKEFQEEFLNRFAFGNPTTEDLIGVFNDVAEKDYTWFFKQWVLSAGHPQLNIESSWKKGELTVAINQTQVGRKTPTKYYLPSKIAFFYKNEVVEEELIIDRKRSIFRFDTKKEPLFVRLDPNDDLLVEIEQNHTYEGLLNKLKRDNVIGRMEAAKLLKKYIDEPKTFRSLKRVAVHDRSWFVRKAAVQSVASEFTSKDFLIAFIREKHSQPRRSLISEMSKYHPQDAIKLIRKYLDKDDSYIVQAEMIKQLGNHGDASDIDRIKRYVEPWSPRKIMRIAANKSLTQLQEK